MINPELLQHFEIELPEGEVQDAIHKKIETQDTPTRGFRSVSRMPLSFILKRYGEDFLTGVLQELLTRRMDAEIAAKQYDVAGNIQITGQWSIHDRPLRYKYIVTFETYPKFDIKGLESLQIRAPARTIVDDSHIDTCLNILRRERSTWVPVTERGAKLGDRATINFDSFLEDGSTFAGGRADNVNVELGAGGMLPEFENALVGVVPGRTIDFPVHFPKDYRTTHLAGKTACFTVKVVSVFEFDLVPLDDTFPARCNATGTLAELREATRVHLQQQHDDQDQREIASDLLRQLMEANPIPLPVSLIAMQLQELQRATAEQRGITLEQVQIDDTLVGQAQARVHSSVIVRRLIAQEGIKINENVDLTEQVIDWLKTRAASNP